MSWLSVAKWPYPQVRLSNFDNTSTDRHATKDEALNVIRMLEKEGVGGNGNIFPIETYVMPDDSRK